MWIPSHSLGFDALDRFGVELLAGLRRVPQTAALTEHLADAHRGLIQGQEAIRARESDALVARSDLRFAELELEVELQGFAEALEHEDRGPGGYLVTFVYPQGVNHEVTPRSRKQLARAEAVIERAQHPSLKVADEVRATWLKLLGARVDEFRRALEAREAAVEALKKARREGRLLRHAYVVEVDRVAGQLRVLFPRDARRRNAIWPRPLQRRRRAGTEAVLEEEDGEGDVEEAISSDVAAPLPLTPPTTV